MSQTDAALTVTNSYKCLKVQQRPDHTGPECLLFSAPVHEVLLWAAIERFTSDAQNGPQRLEKPYKVRAVSSFFSVDSRNIIPSAIVVGLRPGKFTLNPTKNCPEMFTLKLDFQCPSAPEDLPGIIVDGQHRLLGMRKFNPATRVNIVALVGADDTETAFQFLVINNKAAKVASDHIRALALHYEKDELDDRLRKVRLNLDANLRFVGYANALDESPFKGLLALPINPPETQIVAPAAIEEAVGYLRQQKVEEFQEDDLTLSLFFGLWRILKDKWPHLWTKESNLLQKVSIVCTTQFFVDNLLRKYRLERVGHL